MLWTQEFQMILILGWALTCCWQEMRIRSHLYVRTRQLGQAKGPEFLLQTQFIGSRLYSMITWLEFPTPSKTNVISSQHMPISAVRASPLNRRSLYAALLGQTATILSTIAQCRKLEDRTTILFDVSPSVHLLHYHLVQCSHTTDHSIDDFLRA